MRQGLSLVSAGLLLGLPFAWLAARLAERSLFGVRAADPLPFAGVALLLLAAGWCASRQPARRATGVDPAVVLRGE